MYSGPSESRRVTWWMCRRGIGDLSRRVPLSWALRDNGGVSPVIMRGIDAA